MRVLSVCTNLPSAEQPTRGLFVARRLSEMASRSEVIALNPEPYFPGVRRRLGRSRHFDCGFQVDVRPMFYIPRFAKELDGWWMSRCVGQWLDTLGKAVYQNAILDAHFGYPEGVGCFLAARKRGIPVFITIRGLETDLFRHRRIGQQLVSSMNAASGVIAVSQSLKASAEAAGVRAEKITVIPNGVDAQFYTPGDRAAARAEISFPLDRKLIVCIGTLKPVKGHDVLLRAFAKAEFKHPCSLVCIGSTSDGDWFHYLEKLAAQLGIQDSLTFAGTKPPHEVVQWLRASDLFALASHREGCCNAVIEALSTGIPVVATAAGDNAEFVVPDQSGYLSPPADVDQLASNLALAMKSKWSTEQISRSMLNRSWATAAVNVLGLFEKVLEIPGTEQTRSRDR